MLKLDAVETGYGETKIVRGLNLAVAAGSVHTLLGRNGVGKTTTLKSIIGQLALSAGSIEFRGTTISGMNCHQIAKLGIAWVPETRDIFSSLSVLENLELASRLAGSNASWTLERTLDFFPNLKARLNNGGSELSGGEQQMLAIGRALMAEPQIMLLDEPTEGLAPIIIQQIFGKLAELKQVGLTILLVEQNLNFALGLADEVSLMGRGSIVWNGSAAQLRQDQQAQAKWLGV